MALGVAAAALERRRRLEDVPQGPRAGLAAGREVVEGEDELVALVADVGGALAVRRGLRRRLLLTLALALVGVQDLGGKKYNIIVMVTIRDAPIPVPAIVHYLEYPGNFFGICAVHVGVSDRPDVEQLTARRTGKNVFVNHHFHKLCFEVTGSGSSGR